MNYEKSGIITRSIMTQGYPVIVSYIHLCYSVSFETCFKEKFR